MAALTVQTVSILAGVIPTYAAAAGGGDTFANDGRTLLHVKVGGAGAETTVTVNSLVNCDQGVDHNAACVIAIGSEKVFGPFPPDRFNNSSGVAAISYSGVTAVTIGALKY